MNIYTAFIYRIMTMLPIILRLHRILTILIDLLKNENKKIFIFSIKKNILKLYAHFAFVDGNYLHSEKLWRSYRIRYPEEHIGYEQGIALYRLTRHFAAAEALCREAAEKFEQAWVDIAWAEIAMTGQLYAEGIERWKRLYEKYPDKYHLGLRGMARAHSLLYDFEQAEALLNSEKQHIGSKVWYHTDLADISMRRKDYSSALEHWETARKYAPHVFTIYTSILSAYKALNKIDTFNNFLSLAQKNLSHQKYHMLSIEAAAYKKEYAEQINLSTSFIETYPYLAYGYRMLSHALFSMEQHKQAEKVTRKAITIFPYDINFHTTLIELLIEQNDQKNGLPYFLSLHKRFGDYYPYSKSYFTIALKLFRYCQDTNDIESIKKFIDVFLNEQIVLIHINATPNSTLYFHRALAESSSNWKMTIQDIAQDSLDKRAQEKDRPQRVAIFARFILDYFHKHYNYHAFLLSAHRTMPLIMYHHILCSFIYNDHKDYLYQFIDKLFITKTIDTLNGAFIFTIALVLLKSDDEHALSFLEKTSHYWHQYNLPLSSPLSTLMAVYKNRTEGLKRGKTIALIKQRQKKLRIGLLLSGQMRGYQESKKTWKNLNLDGHDLDVFVHTWRNRGGKWPVALHGKRVFGGAMLQAFNNLPYRHVNGHANSMNFFKTYYPSLFQLIERHHNTSILPQELCDFYHIEDINDIVVDNIDDEKFKTLRDNGSTLITLYKRQECFRLLEKKKKEYDLVFSLRSEQDIQSFAHPIDWNELLYNSCVTNSFYSNFSPKYCLQQDYEIFHSNNITKTHINFKKCTVFPMLGDVFAVGSYDTMRIYCNAYQSIAYNIASKQYYLLGMDHLVHVGAMAIAFLQGVGVQCFDPSTVMFDYCDPPKISPASLYQALLADVESRQEFPTDKPLLEAAKRDAELEAALQQSL